MRQPVQIQSGLFYDFESLNAVLGLKRGAVERARRDGDLRSTRRGGRVLFLGQWVIDWLTAGESEEEQVEEAVAC